MKKSQKSKNLTRRVYYKKHKNIFCSILWVFLIFFTTPKVKKYLYDLTNISRAIIYFYHT